MRATRWGVAARSAGRLACTARSNPGSEPRAHSPVAGTARLNPCVPAHVATLEEPAPHANPHRASIAQTGSLSWTWDSRLGTRWNHRGAKLGN